MPTYELMPEFSRDYGHLNEEQKRAFRLAVKKFLIDLRAGRSFRSSLRVKSLQDHPGVFELTWEGNDGRATFDYVAREASRGFTRTLASYWQS